MCVILSELMRRTAALSEWSVSIIAPEYTTPDFVATTLRSRAVYLFMCLCISSVPYLIKQFSLLQVIITECSLCSAAA